MRRERRKPPLPKGFLSGSKESNFAVLCKVAGVIGMSVATQESQAELWQKDLWRINNKVNNKRIYLKIGLKGNRAPQEKKGCLNGKWYN